MTFEIVVQTGHVNNVMAVAFAPDGRSLATAGADESIRLWDIALGVETGVLQGHLGPVYQLAFDGNGLLASGGWDHDVRIWDVEARSTRQVLKGLEYQLVQQLAFSVDGSIVAATGMRRGGGAQHVLAWDVSSGEVVASVELQVDTEARGCAIALTPTGDQLAFTGCGQALCVLDLPGGTPHELVVDAGLVKALAFTGEGSTLLVLLETVLRTLDAASGRLLSEQSVRASGSALTVMPRGTVAVHGTDHTLLLEDPPRVINARCDAIARGADLLARTDGHLVELFDPRSLAVTRRLTGRLGFERAPGNLLKQFVLAASPVEPLLAAAGPDGLIRLWDLARAPGPTVIRAHDGWVNALEFNSDGTLLASAGADGVRIWPRAGGPAVLAAEPEGGATELAFSADSSALVMLGHQHVTAVEIPSGTEIRSVVLDDLPSAVDVSPYNDVVVGSKGSLSLWAPFLAGDADVMPAAEVREVRFGLDGRLAIALGGRKWLKTEPGRGAVYSPQDESLTPLEGHAAAVRAIDFAPDIASVATGGEDGALMVWNPVNGERQFAVERAHAGDVTSVAFLHDSRYVASTGYDGVVRLWNARDGKLAATLASLDENDYVAFTPEGRYSATKPGLGAIVLRTDDGLFPFEQFDLQLNRPDRVLGQLGYAPRAVTAAFADAHRRRLARLGVTDPDAVSTAALPQLRLTGRPEPVTDTGTCPVGVQLVPGQRPVRQLHVTVEGVPIYGRAGLALGPDETARTLAIPLTPGENEVQLWAVDAGSAQSTRRSFRVFDSRREQPRRLLVVAVGVSAYHDERYRLEYAAKDASDLVTELTFRGTRFAAVEPLLLPDATREEILSARQFLESSSPQDHVVLLFAGHGVLLGAEFAFLPADTVADDLPARALRYGEIEGLLDGIAARRRLVLLDTCHSGEEEGLGATIERAQLTAGVTRGRRDMIPEAVPSALPGQAGPVRKGPPILVSLRDTFADLRQESGAFVIAAAGAAEYALEREDLRNGVFTASVIETLRAEPRPKVTHLASEVSRRVLALTGGRQQPMVRRENLAEDYEVV